MSNVTRLPDPSMLRMLPTCPPPIPPAPLTPPSLASTGTGDLLALPGLLAQPHADPSLEGDSPALRVVPRPRHRAARAPFVTLVLLLLGGGLVSLLLINTALSQGAFAVQKLQRENVALTERQQELDKALADADQPQSLARKAVELGMVPGGAPAFLHLPDGKVAGTPAVATSPPPPAPVTTAPVTTAPVTTAPVTTAPATTAPATTAPATSAPATAPATGAATSAAAPPAGTATTGATPTGHPTPTGHATPGAGKATTSPNKAAGTSAAHTPAAGRTTPTKGKP